MADCEKVAEKRQAPFVIEGRFKRPDGKWSRWYQLHSYSDRRHRDLFIEGLLSAYKHDEVRYRCLDYLQRKNQ